MLIFGVFIGSLGIACIMLKRTFIGLLMGVHLLTLGTTSAFVLGGFTSGQMEKGYIFGLFILVSGISQLVIGWALAIRIFYLGGSVDMESMRRLKE